MTKRIILITGVGGKIGFSIAEKLQDNNILIGLTRSNIDSITQRLKSFNEQNLTIKCDLCNTSDIEDAFKIIQGKFDRLDLVINAAGYNSLAKFGDLSSISNETVSQILNTNLIGPFLVIKESIKLLHNSTDPLVINISSISGMKASKSNPIYGASKAGLDLLTKTLALHLAPIRIVGIAPGTLDYPTSGIKMRDKEKYYQNMKDRSPLKILGTCDDVARLVLSIVNNMPILTGQTIVLDGGLSL